MNTMIQLTLRNEDGIFTYGSEIAGAVHRTLHRIFGDATMVSVYCEPKEEEIWKKKLYRAMQEKIFEERNKFYNYAAQAGKEYLALEKLIKAI